MAKVKLSLSLYLILPGSPACHIPFFAFAPFFSSRKPRLPGHSGESFQPDATPHSNINFPIEKHLSTRRQATFEHQFPPSEGKQWGR